jgi:HD-GYP domain-containing protein (c-di-GMP phosphodiesterase class II)
LISLERGGYFHDIGKIGIPDAVLLKRGRLTTAERRIMEQHPIIGDRLCGNLRVLHRVRPIVRHHHERLDGSGYPDALEGDAIPLTAQIIGIVDVYDAITTNRPNFAARPSEEAFSALRAEVTADGAVAISSRRSSPSGASGRCRGSSRRKRRGRPERPRGARSGDANPGGL